jgi:transposase
VTDLWTLPRVAEVIERVTGVCYHPGHAWNLLRDQLGWTWQQPARRAVKSAATEVSRLARRS